MLKKMSVTAAVVGALSIAFVPFAASAQGTGTEPPKAPSPAGGGAMKGGAMKGGAMKGGAMSKKAGGGAMMKKGHGKKM